MVPVKCVLSPIWRESAELEMEMESSPGSQFKPVDQEPQERQGRKKGGWITLPFIAGAYKITSLFSF